MDPAHLLLWLACASSALQLHRLLRAPRPRPWEWIIPNALVLAAAAALFPVSRSFAGHTAGALWIGFVVLPVILGHLVSRLGAAGRDTAALALSWLVAALHPTRTARATPTLLAALRLAGRGDIEPALRRLDTLRASPLAVTAGYHARRLRGDWAGLLDWLDTAAHEPNRPDAVLARLRTLGELGRHDDLALTFDQFAYAWPLHAWHTQGAWARLLVLAFTGRVEGTRALLHGTLRHAAPVTQASFEATALSRAGQAERAVQRWIELTRSAPRPIAASLAPRFDAAGPDPDSYAAASSARLEREVQQHEARETRVRHAPVTHTLIGLNIAMFLLAACVGGTEDETTLLRLGAFVPSRLAEDGAWRAVTAMFLHFGWLHLAMNLLALRLLGPRVEVSLGRVRYPAVYLASGLAGMLAVAAAGNHPDEMVVGASGCIMGIVGALAVLLLRQWRARRTLAARQRFAGIAIALGLQSAFDLSTPQISMTAHLGGAAAGIVLTWWLTRRRPAEPV